jgi:hypothetical protein
MAEVYPSDNSLLNIVNEIETGVEYIETGKAPYYLEFRKMLYRLLLASKRANDLRVFDEGGLDIGVKAGKFWDGMVLRSYAGSSGNVLADNKSHIYVYLDASGALVTDEYTSWPDIAESHIRLADITTSSGDIVTIADARDHHMFSSPGTIKATGKALADLSDDGGVTVVFEAAVSNGNTVAIHNADAPFKYRVIDAWSVASSADGGSWKLTNGTNDISDTVNVTGVDKAVDRAGTLDDAYNEIAADGSLSVVGDGTLTDCQVYILAVRVN